MSTNENAHTTPSLTVCTTTTQMKKEVNNTETNNNSNNNNNNNNNNNSQNKKNIVILSGGTATNSLIDTCFQPVLYNKITFILPISDNGGSSSEIIRLFPGAAPGDFRSRIVKLIDPKTKEDIELCKIMNYRLNEDDIDVAKKEWNDIVEGCHPVWADCSTILKHMIRGFLINVHIEILKKQQMNSSSTQKFDFRNANIGNFFLTGCRLLIGSSFDSALELMLRICKVDTNKIKVFPCINTNYTHHIAAILQNGQIIIGQSQISHPSTSVSVLTREEDSLSNSIINLNNSSTGLSHLSSKMGEDDEEEDEDDDVDIKSPDEDVNNRIHPDLKISQLSFTKSNIHTKLASPIEKIVYINPYGEIIQPLGNPRCVHSVKHADILVYSIGSLMTSLLPILILPNVAEAVVCNKKMKKILLINSEIDRETEQFANDFETNAFVNMIVKSVYDNLPIKYKPLNPFATVHNTSNLNVITEPVPLSFYSQILTDVIYLNNGDIKVNEKDLRKKGINVHCINSESKKFDGQELQEILSKISC